MRLGEAGYGIRVRTRVTAPVFSSALNLLSYLVAVLSQQINRGLYLG